MKMSHKEMRCGIWKHNVCDLVSAIKDSNNSGYNFIVTPIIHPRSHEFTPHCDLQLSSTDWATLVIGKISNYDLECKPLENAQKIDDEITYAMHLGLPALIFDCPSDVESTNQLARLINSKITLNGGFQNLPQFWIHIAVEGNNLRSDKWVNNVEVDLDTCNKEDTWKIWNQMRNQITPDKRVSIALELTADLPDTQLLDRWAGEPIKAIILPTSIFLSNKKNYPVLSRGHQIFIRILIDKMARDLVFIIKGNSNYPDIRYYSQYIDHLKSTQMPLDQVSGFAKGYEDFLQIPLQPLMDNLESCTYEVFEKDPVKYAEYGRAILEAMTTKFENESKLVVMVVGAGRGPLVHASLEAAFKCNKYVHVYAVEKNVNAVVTLKSLRDERWGGESGLAHGIVQVINCDMRDWDAPQKADIVVSELLGSFGDNELSPECLDGVWSYVKENAISIPVSYTSYLAPVQSQRLFCEVALLKERDKPAYAPFETGYVVHMRNCYHIDSPQALFSFDHSNLLLKPSQRDNSRFAFKEFAVKVDTVCHGFGGYFETTLFGDIKLSTVPTNHTPGMFSWFPIFFPLHSPVNLKSGDTLRVNFWRLTNKRQIWYEWCLTSPCATNIHNPNGRSYSIGLL